ncbi:MAG: hypothetical protein COV44_11230 [Deltaproteobacteria bacterium CG11_big_fil_rev_8_21_14_0_20_45_16]|nr:MAG: hypothetical protein COV44_11230 [Deltaproteobacteria bacterium CG11_big_fil_rev_8_21_14_0_20_45_16]
MYDIFYKLYSYQRNKNRKLQAFYYRSRAILNRPCQEIPLCSWWNPKSKLDRKLASLLARSGPLDSRDLSDTKMRRRLLLWKKSCPMDPAFFRHFLKWEKVWREYSRFSLWEFMQSAVFKSWYQKRSRLKRRSYFELDAPYRASKVEVLNERLAVKALLRSQPLLRFEDLKAMKIKNAQLIMKGLPDLKKRRLDYLKKLKGRQRSSK